jgi:hypothetical protein
MAKLYQLGDYADFVSFSGQIFEFHFLLSALTVGMDFLAKIGLSIISDKQQVLIVASGCTFSKATTASFIKPWSPETTDAALPSQLQQLLQEFQTPLRPSAATPQTALTQIVPLLFLPALGGWTKKISTLPRRSSLH